jgi:hypothetical protein
MPCVTCSFAPATRTARCSKVGTRVAVGTRVPATPATFRKYLAMRRCLGVSHVTRVASARDARGGFAGRAPRRDDDKTSTSSSSEEEEPAHARSSAPPAHRFASASALWRRVRNVIAAFCVGIAVACTAAAPALAFGAPFGGSSLAGSSSYASTAAAFGETTVTVSPGFNGVGDSPPSVYAMKNLPVAVGDVGSIGMLGSPAGIGIPYHGKNPGIALFMASGGVAVRMLINVAVIYAIHKYWMGGDDE